MNTISMIIPTSQFIDRIIATATKKNRSPKLSIIQVGESSKIKDAITAKQKLAAKMKIRTSVVSLKKRPLRYEELLFTLKTEAAKEENHAVLVQQPLPSAMQSDTLYNFVPLEKEVEAHRPKSPFLPPMGLAVLHMIRYSIDETVEPLEIGLPAQVDPIYSKTFRSKKIVLLGKNSEGAEPIGTTLTMMKMNYIHLFSGTAPSAIEGFCKEADVIVNTSTKIAIKPEMIKPEATIISTVPIKGAEKPELLSEIAQTSSYVSELDKPIAQLRDAYLLYNVWLAAGHASS